MRRPTPASFALIVFWTLYAFAAAWALYDATPLLSRDLLLILVGYGAFLVVVTGVVLLYTRFGRSRGAQS